MTSGGGMLFSRGLPRQSGKGYQWEALAYSPFTLQGGCRIEFFLQIQAVQGSVEVKAYHIAFLDIPENENGIRSLRFDLPGHEGKGNGWDDDLRDNPEHPKSHLHINFDSTAEANDLRLAMGSICPLTLLRSFDHWYCKAFGV
jgi:hypothetical protein